jgi:tetratricopeptide (TPR) repeat protein
LTVDKVTRKELLKKDDAFLAAAAEGVKWLTSHRIQVIAASVAVVAVIVGTWGVVEYIRVRDRAASELFDRGLKVLDAEILPEGSTDAATPDDPESPKFAKEADKLKALRDTFAKVVEEKGGSGVANLALFFVADADQKLGDKEKAETEFKDLAERLSPADSLYFLAVERAAYLQEARGDADSALKSFGRLVNTDGGFYRDQATFHQARLYLAKGDKEKARNLLERIEKDFPESSVAEKARDRLQEIGPAPVEAPATPEKAAPAPTEAKTP